MHPAWSSARPPAAAAGGRIERCPRRWTHLGTGCSRTHMGSTCVWDLDSLYVRERGVVCQNDRWLPPLRCLVAVSFLVIRLDAFGRNDECDQVFVYFCARPAGPRLRRRRPEEGRWVGRNAFALIFFSTKSHTYKEYVYTVRLKSFLFTLCTSSSYLAFFRE